MGREFIDIFDEWAHSYEASVAGENPEYRDVFEGYDNILTEVAIRAFGNVIEFGTGTGNLTEKLVELGYLVIGVEPNLKMRTLTSERLPSIKTVDGDLLQFEASIESVDAIVSSYVFHHLTDDEKGEALKKYSEILSSKGKVIFADTAFTTEDAKKAQIEKERSRAFHHVADDLEREYYTTIPILKKLFNHAGFQVIFTQMNDFVWLMDATKK